ncbi:phosphoprotein phosphatase [Bifidobacteriaceae bacterium MCC01968]|uniref:PP2C family protein-serine/threonine phosphatase n=1 Tax=Bifidobacterium breve TaxID=1685 RepID=UPI000CA2916B|nr:PP2C family serine/threonine-protein phosphatase [Bifidobacterium breve]GDZ31979.1 phosphoprotein phosphatase [Bifidobacteriaceae bacterium MCC01961]GDZ68967.1 phosphoprotein phosphatase [Bifidobacteriaceae bacterium MCC02039]GDZ81108.1 phosphoprotein phosphatase [Bifidobacteriaceae bacterium MCC01968]AUD66291.1 Protein phosphatase 2C [Bifidobacterium breve]MED7617454.1 serine/threonine-protein phosphatase [Bifidobacterium breve]
MPNSAASQPLFLYSTTVSDVGTVRANNQDSSFAGEHLIAICDGMGGHAGGDTASSIAIRSLAHIEQDDTGGDVEVISRMMETSVMAAHDAIVGKAKRERKLAGMGTTVTAVALVAGYWVVAHIGDSRAYLLRDGHLSRITCDHSYVQHLIDTGRITPAEAKNHPQRNVVMRVLGDFDIDPHPDISIRKAHPADRWLLCSDGLCGVLEDSTIKETMTALADQGECAQRLVQMALRAGSTDNVTAVIADATLALDADAFDLPHQTPLVGGAASRNLEPIADIVNEPVATAPALRDDHSPAKHAAALMQPADTQHNDAAPASAEPSTTRVVQPSAVREETGERDNPDTGEIPVVQKPDGRLSADPNDPEVAKAIRDEHVEQKKATRAKHQRNRLAIVITILLAVAVLFGAGTGTYMWSQTRYYVGNSNGKVAIYQGVPTNLFGLALSHEVSSTSITVSNLPQTWRDQLNRGISVGSLDEAQSHVGIIRSEMNKFKKQQESEQAKKSTSSNSSGSSNSSTSGNTNKSESGIGAADDATTGGSQ